MNPSQEEALFTLALAKSAAERAAFLDHECALDTALRQRLEALLAAHEQSQGALNEPSPAARATMKLAMPGGPDETVGQKIGRYKILEKIGEGGCGVVYVAEQTEPVRRRVALKVIKLGMDTRQVIARFEAERQALAMMDHPNIAKVLDAGSTESGRPYFVMELVRGIKLTEYCDQNKLSTEARLQLFVQVCHAIQHAHQKGIVHRDIKPSNILVTLHDGIPVPMVIDFGIAKATEGRLSEHTVYTQLHQFIGTPAYMSPEQAEMSGLDIDTRSDIYSLGVLLYELLAGSTPFDAKELIASGIDAMRRIIREKEPARPSTRLSTLPDPELTTAAQRRSVDTRRLVKLLKGDLDWIVMKCLEKDRTRRYETANGLAADLRRHLNSEPIIARPPDKIYRFRKAIQRNKVAFAAAIVTVAALLSGLIFSSWQAVRAIRAETRAQRERSAATDARAETDSINRFLTEDLLFQATPEHTAREKGMSVEQLLERASQRLDKNPQMARQPLTEATLRIAIGTTYSKLGLFNESERQLRRAVELRRRELGPDNFETLLAQNELITLLLGNMNRFDEDTERLSRETWQSLHRLLDAKGYHITDTNLYKAMLDGESEYIWALANRGELDQAVELKRKNTAAFEQVFGREHPETMSELHNLALVLARHGDYAEAEQLEEEALRRFTHAGKADTDSAFSCIAGLAGCRFFLGKTQAAESTLVEAIPRAERGLGPEHPATLHLQSYLARVMAEQGRLSEAETLARNTMLARQRVLGTNAFNTAYTTLILGRVLVKRGKLEEAVPVLETARTIFRGQFARIPEFAAEAENWLGSIYLTRQDMAQAEALLLGGAEKLMTPAAYLSPNEQRDSIGHVIKLYQTSGRAEKATDLQRRLDQMGKSADGEKSTQPTPTNKNSHTAG